MVKNFGCLALSLIIFLVTSGSAVTKQERSLSLELKLAQELLQDHKYVEAELVFRKALKIASQNPSSRLQIVECLNFIGVSLHAQGKSKLAIEFFEKALTSLPKNLYWKRRMKILSNTALAYAAAGEKAKAITFIEKSILVSSKHTIGAVEESVLLNNFGQLLIDANDLVRAESALTKSIQLREKVMGSFSEQIISPLINLSLVYIKLGQLDEGEQCCKRAISISNKNESGDDLVFSAWNNLGDIYVKKRNLDEAENCFERAYEIAEMRLGSMNPLTLKMASNLARIYEVNGKVWSANQIFERMHVSPLLEE